MQTDTQKTLQTLREVGTKGVHSFELNRFIGSIRSAARINDLKKLGYSIISKSEKYMGVRGVRYFLSSSPHISPIEKQKHLYIFDSKRQIFVETYPN